MASVSAVVIVSTGRYVSDRLGAVWTPGEGLEPGGIRPHFVRGVDVRAARVLASRVLDGGRFDYCSSF